MEVEDGGRVMTLDRGLRIEVEDARGVSGVMTLNRGLRTEGRGCTWGE